MRNISLKIVTVVLLLAALTIIFSGCGAVAVPKPTPLPGVPTFPITGNCDIAIANNVIKVSGQTDLMDGALMHVSVVAQNGMTMDSVTITKSGNQISQNFNLTDKYKNITSVEGFITCAPTLYGKQPDNVYKNYGQKFEYIVTSQDNYIWDKDGIIFVFASKLTNLPK